MGSELAAMLLAAGRGSRLRPLTDVRPKALVPVANRPLLEWHRESLAELGVGRLLVNASHLADQVVAHAGQHQRPSQPLEILLEDAPLGTGGGLLGARRRLERESCFLVLNADAFQDLPLADALAAHRQSEAAATVLVRRTEVGEPQDALTIDPAGTVTGVPEMGGEETGWRFTGVHMLSPSVFEYLTATGSLLIGYHGLLAAGAKIAAYDCGDALWFDVGTPCGYLDANLAAAEIEADHQPGPAGVELIQPVLVDRSARIEAGAEIGPGTVIGAGAEVGAGSRLSECVVWPETVVPAGSTVHRSVAFPGGTLQVDGD